MTNTKKSALKWALPVAGIALIAVTGATAWYFTQGRHQGTILPTTKVAVQDDALEEVNRDQPDTTNTQLTDVRTEPTPTANNTDAPPEETELGLSATTETDGQRANSHSEEVSTAVPEEIVEDATDDAVIIEDSGTIDIATSDSAYAEEDQAPDIDATPEDISDQGDTDIVALSDDEEAGDESDDSAIIEDTPLNLADAEKIETLETALREANRRADDLEAEITRLREQHETSLAEIASTNERYAALQRQLTNVRQENRTLREEAKRAPAVTGAVALNEITRALAKGEPYSGALLSLKDTVSDTEEIDLLGTYADGSAPSISNIQREFRDAVRAGLSAARKAEATSVSARYSARLLNVINLRPSTPQPGSTPDAIISRAEFAVENGELSAAISELREMPDPAQEAMKDWITLAEKRIAIEDALASLNASIAREANG